MNHTLLSKLPSIDVQGISSTIEQALSSAGLRTDSGPMRGVTDTIRRALASAGVHTPNPIGAETHTDTTVIDLAPPATAGTFVTHQFRNHAGARAYKLFVPASEQASSMPLVVMLHGCTQSADDFAAGTRMNRLAAEHGFIVAYPEQAPNANGSKCWNWFKAQDQVRDSGEPSLIAGITREIAARHPVDPRRVYVAGLSAGAAMAVILGETYPELYAAVGAHSGLPYAAAHDVPSAFAAMAGGQGGASRMPRGPQRSRATAAPRTPSEHFVPTIVFHGDRDQTVGQINGAAIVENAAAAMARDAVAGVTAPITQTGVAPRGRSYSRAVYADDAGRPRIESWVLHGAGHAWAGGDASGSYTDTTGPDASAEMVRFFLAQAPADAA